eukprot:1322776-Amorphochlora_amoeboformis.AAC.2
MLFCPQGRRKLYRAESSPDTNTRGGEDLRTDCIHQGVVRGEVLAKVFVRMCRSTRALPLPATGVSSLRRLLADVDLCLISSTCVGSGELQRDN